MRLFFALWPDEALRNALYGLAERFQGKYGGRLMRKEFLHLTLLFMGDTPVSQLDNISHFVCDLKLKRFLMELDLFSGWRANRIGYCGPSESPAGLIRLSEGLRARIEAAGCRFDQKLFVPHVTLLRHLAEVPRAEAVTPIRWEVKDFVLVRSMPERHGVRYEILRRWQLD